MPIQITFGILPDDIAEGFSQEPGELFSTLHVLATFLGQIDQRVDFLNVFTEAASGRSVQEIATVAEMLRELLSATKEDFI